MSGRGLMCGFVNDKLHVNERDSESMPVLFINTRIGKWHMYKQVVRYSYIIFNQSKAVLHRRLTRKIENKTSKHPFLPS